MFGDHNADRDGLFLLGFRSYLPKVMVGDFFWVGVGKLLGSCNLGVKITV